MAVSTCLKCAGHSFELAMFTPMGENHKLTIVQYVDASTAMMGETEEAKCRLKRSRN